MTRETKTVADDGARYGDELIRKATWAVVGLVVIVEAAAMATGVWRTFSYRIPFTVGLLALIASLYSFARTPVEKRPQKLRSIAIALVLAAMVGMFYAATIVRLGGNVFKRAI